MVEKAKTFFYRYFELIIIVFILLLVFISDQGNADYNSFHYAARMISEGDGKDIYDPEKLNQRAEEDGLYAYPYLYPPFFATMLIPLSQLETHKAYWIYFVILIPFLFLFFRYLKIIYHDKNKPYKLLFIFIAAVLSSSTTRNLTLGQSNIIVFSLWVVSLKMFMDRKSILPSILLSISILIKLIPAASLLILFFDKRYKDIFLTILSSIVLILITILISGFRLWEIYLGNFFAISSHSTGDTGIRKLFEMTVPSYQSLWILIPIVFLIFMIYYRKNIGLKNGWALISGLFLIATPLLWAVSILPFFTALSYYPSKVKNIYLRFGFYIVGLLATMRYSLYGLFVYRIIPISILLIIVLFIEGREYFKYVDSESGL
ncbi:MAG: glycosyltransferase family 87 protein [Candidatus Zixiibacteriota bacterium]